MRVSLKRKRQRVVIVPAERLPDHLIWYRDVLRRDLGDRDVRGMLDALFRNQGQSRRNRSQWLAYLFDGAQHHPEPFDLTGEVVGDARWAQLGPDAPPSKQGPDDPTDDGQAGSGIPRRPPDSPGSAAAQATLPGDP